MNVTSEKFEDATMRVTITVTKNDYQAIVKKSLDDIRKNVVIAGFRKGNAPQFIIQSIYGEKIFKKEINKLVSNELLEYVKNNKLNILAEPLLVKNNLDWCHQEEYKFLFDIGLQPEGFISLVKNDELPYYTVSITDKMIKNRIDALKMQYSKHDDKINIIKDGDIIKGNFTAINEYNTLKKRNGINLNVVLMLFFMQDEEEKAKFIGKKTGDTIIFNPYKAFGENRNELLFFLKIWEMRIVNYQDDFSFTITEICRYSKEGTNQKLFNKLYELGLVSSEEMLKKKIEESLSLQLRFESDYHFFFNAKYFLLKKIKDIKFPEAFLKRWFIKTHFKYTKKVTEKEFLYFLQDVKMQFIWNKIVETNGIKVILEDIRQVAKDFVRSQFALSNLYIVSDNVLESHIDQTLKIEKNIKLLYNKALEIKIINVLKKTISLKSVLVTEKEIWNTL